MVREWNMTLRHGRYGNGYQVAIPAEFATSQDIAARDEMMVWCDGTGISVQKRTTQIIPKYSKRHPVGQKIFVKSVQPSGKTLVLTLPIKAVRLMGLEGVEKVTIRDMEDRMHILPAAGLPDPASVVSTPGSSSEQQPQNAQSRVSAHGFEPFVLRAKPLYKVSETLNLSDYLASGS